MSDSNPASTEIADTAIENVASLFREDIRNSMGDSRLDYVRMLLFDAVSCAYAARESGPVVREIEAFDACDSLKARQPDLVLFGMSPGMHVEDAVVVNGTMLRYLDANDTYIGDVSPCHPSDNIAAILTAAAYWGRTFGDLLKAIVAAYGIHMYLADKLPLHGAGWHNVSGGSIAVPISAGIMLAGLTHVQARHALSLTCMRGLVGPSSPGEISMVKAAAHALGAAESIRHIKMAQKGFTGPRFAIEGLLERAGWGGLRDDVDSFDVDWTHIENVSIKPYPAAVFMHSSIEAVLALRQESLISPNDVRYIVITTMSFVVDNNVKDRAFPQTRETADHSLQYCAAIALIEGSLGTEQFAEGKWLRPDVMRLMGLVSVRPSPEMDAMWPKRPANVEIGLRDGRVVSRTIDDAFGGPHRRMNWVDLVDKAKGLAGKGQEDWAESAFEATRDYNLSGSVGGYLARLRRPE